MHLKRQLLVVLLAVMAFVAVAARPAPAQVQSTVSNADVQRLQDSVFTIGSDLSRLRGRDPQMAAQLQDELDDLREEVIYLKVRLRKEGTVPRSEYTDLRDRLEDLRTRALGPQAQPEPARPAVPERPTPPAPATPPAPPTPPAPVTPPAPPTPPPTRPSRTQPNEVPSGQELDVRLQSALSSQTAQVEDRFTATTMVDVIKDDRVLIPAGSEMRGVVTSVDKATRTDRKGSLTVTFDQITIRGRAYPTHATVMQALESEGVRGEAAKIGTAAGVGAIIGGILGGFKGALAGILIGGGGIVAATPGKDVTLDPGTVLRVRLDSSLVVGG
jgi:TolA-binding protein